MPNIPENGVPHDDARTTFYLARHGQTEYNRKGIVQGRRIDSVLNATGRRQAEALTERFAEVELDAIYTSTLRRARQTADALAKDHPDVPVHHLKDLEEMSWGAYEGRPATGAVLEAFEAVKARWRAGDFGAAVDGGESVLQVRRRALRAVRQILDEQAGQAVLVVTHGRFLRVLIASLLNQEYGLEKMHEIEHTNTGVNHLVFREEGCEAQVLNCTAHLGEGKKMVSV